MDWRKLVSVVAAIVAALNVVGAASARDLAGIPWTEFKERSDLVFHGVLTKAELIDGKLSPDAQVRCTYHIFEVFKGEADLKEVTFTAPVEEHILKAVGGGAIVALRREGDHWRLSIDERSCWVVGSEMGTGFRGVPVYRIPASLIHGLPAALSEEVEIQVRFGDDWRLMKRKVFPTARVESLLTELLKNNPAGPAPTAPSTQSRGVAKRAGDFPYVAPGLAGRFYAKSVPHEMNGTKGTTRIYRVGRDADEALDTYDWYAPYEYECGVVLGWSPKVGKVAVMRVHNEPAAVADDRVELSFYLGGKFLKSYTCKDLVSMGATTEAPGKVSADESRVFLAYRVLGCEQIWNTNDSRFVIVTARDRRVMFDILTGEVVPDVEHK